MFSEDVLFWLQKIVGKDIVNCILLFKLTLRIEIDLQCDKLVRNVQIVIVHIILCNFYEGFWWCTFYVFKFLESNLHVYNYPLCVISLISNIYHVLSLSLLLLVSLT